VHFLNGKNPRQAWREARKTVHCKSIQDILQNFFDSLGNSDRITQDNVCQIAIEQLREIQKQINEEVASRSKLSRTIGLLSGAFLAIILL
jgi:stage III sporulation protein AB